MAQRLSTARQAGVLLSSRRKALGLSQAELAAKLGVSQARVSELENRPETLTLDRLLAMLKVLNLEITITDSIAIKQPANKPTSEW